MSSVPVPPGGATYFLPLFRWSDPTSNLHSNLGVGLSDQAQSVIGSVTGTVLTISNFFWQVAAYLVNFVSDPANNLAANGGLLSSVNNFVATIGGALIVGPAPWIILAAAILLLGVSVLRGRLKVGGGIRCVICLTMLLIMCHAAASPNPAQAVGSPSWVIGKGVAVSNSLAASFSGQVNDVQQHLSPLGNGVPAPNCGQYVSELEAQAQANGAPAADVGLSNLWDQAFLNQWIRVQFGVDGEGFKASCHYLDNESDSSTVDASNTTQWEIGNAAGYPAASPAPTSGGVYGPWEDDDSLERGMIAWAWCDSAGGWHTDPDFVAAEQSRGGNGKECQEWWTQTNTGAATGSQTNKIGPGGNGVFDNHSFPGTNGYAHQFVSWFDGHFTYTAIILALCALIAAFGFGWMFAGIALVVLLSQIGLLVLLFLAPVLLLVMAWPGEGSGKMPGAVARVFGLCMAAKALFLLLLAGLISVFELLSGLVAANYGSVTSAYAVALFPVIAIVVVRLVTKKLGLSNVLSPIGALKVAGAAGSWAMLRSGGGGGRSGLGSRGDNRDRPKSSNDPSRATDRAGERASGMSAVTDRIRNRNRKVDNESPDVMAARRKQVADMAPDTTGMAPGQFAASRGFAISTPRAKRPEEIRNWNAGEGVNPGRRPEHQQKMVEHRDRLKAAQAGSPPLQGKRPGNMLLGGTPAEGPARSTLPQSAKDRATVVRARDERGGPRRMRGHDEGDD